MDPDERRVTQNICMEHQDIAEAIGQRVPFTKQDQDIAKAHGWRPGHPETGGGRGWPLVYFGLRCPLCNALTTMLDGVRETTQKYRALSMAHVCSNTWHLLSYDTRSDACPSCGQVRN